MTRGHFVHSAFVDSDRDISHRDWHVTHLESVEAGYSDIFLEYSVYLTTRSICLEYSDIYLEYVNPFPIPGICLEYS